MRDITLCHPQLQVLAGKLVEECSRQGLQIKIGETLRTVAEQDALYAQGRTRPGNIVTNAPGSSYSSYHQWGTAFDIYHIIPKATITKYSFDIDITFSSPNLKNPINWSLNIIRNIVYKIERIMFISIADFIYNFVSSTSC